MFVADFVELARHVESTDLSTTRASFLPSVRTPIGIEPFLLLCHPSRPPFSLSIKESTLPSSLLYSILSTFPCPGILFFHLFSFLFSLLNEG